MTNRFKMKYFGSCQGKSGRNYTFSRGEILEAPEGEFPDEYAEDVTADFVGEGSPEGDSDLEKPKRGRPKK